ncbi:MAG: hypothetical protein ACKVE4_11075 [Dissulfuribacterales bacterium]
MGKVGKTAIMMLLMLMVFFCSTEEVSASVGRNYSEHRSHDLFFKGVTGVSKIFDKSCCKAEKQAQKRWKKNMPECVRWLLQKDGESKKILRGLPYGKPVPHDVRLILADWAAGRLTIQETDMLGKHISDMVDTCQEKKVSPTPCFVGGLIIIFQSTIRSGIIM